MATTALCQVQLIPPTGDIQYHSLAGVSGLINIGRHRQTAADIVLPHPAIAEYQAVLDCSTWPWRLMALSGGMPIFRNGTPLPVNQFVELATWDSLEIGGYTLLLVDAAERVTPLAPLPSSTTVSRTNGDRQTIPTNGAAPSILSSIQRNGHSRIDASDSAAIGIVPLGTRVVDQMDARGYIAATIAERQQRVDVSRQAMAVWQVDVTNQGPRVDHFHITVEGAVDQAWVVIEPQEPVHLHEGDQATFLVKMTPTYAPTTLAGEHFFVIIVRSDNYPGEASRLGASLVVDPYGSLAVGEPTVKHKKIGHHQIGELFIPIHNQSNHPVRLSMTGRSEIGGEEDHTTRFEFGGIDQVFHKSHWEVPLQPNQPLTVPIRMIPQRRYWVSAGDRKFEIFFTITVLEGGQQTETRQTQLIQRPLIGLKSLLLLLALFLLVLCLLVIVVGRPRIYTFTVESASGEPLTAGDPGVLHWQTSRFISNLKIQKIDRSSTTTKIPETIATVEPGSVSEYRIIVEPNKDYLLEAGNLLTRIPRLGDRLGVATHVANLSVPAVTLAPELTLVPESVVAGEEVLLSWPALTKADVYTLTINDTPVAVNTATTMVGGEYRHSPAVNSTYRLEVGSLFGPLQRSQPRTVVVVQPTPVILEFSADSLTAVPGGRIELVAKVAGANKIQLVAPGLMNAIGITPQPDSIVPLRNSIAIPTDLAPRIYSIELFAEQADLTPMSTPGVNRRSLQLVVVTATPTASITPAPVPIIRAFRVEPTELLVGDAVRVFWDVTGANKVEIKPVVGEVEILASERLIPMTTPGTQQIILQAKAIAPESTALVESVIEVKVLVPTATPTATPTPTGLPTATTTPTLTPTPTPTNTSVPAPKIQTFTALGDTLRLKGTEGTTLIYSIDVGQSIELRWQVSDAQEITLQENVEDPFIGLSAEQSITERVLQNVSYVLRAKSPGAIPEEDSRTIRFEVNPPQIPPPPTNIRGKGGETNEQPTTIAWDYAGNTDLIIGFRVYRAVVGSTDFSRVADAGSADNQLGPTVTTWTDTEVPTCGRAYYVVAVYMDPRVDPPQSQETAPTDTFNTVPCPTPTPSS